MDQDKRYSDGRPAPQRQAAVCVSGATEKSPGADFVQPATPPSRRTPLNARQFLNSAQICSRFEQLSGRGGEDALDAEGTNKRKSPGAETQQTI